MPYTKEEKAEYMMLWRQKNKEQIKEYRKEYRQKNKDEIKEYRKEYRQKNKDEIKRRQKEYNQTPKGIKVNRLADWRKSGLIHDDIDELYERYLQSTHCDECEEEFVNDRGLSQRCMDHCHQTGLFRNFLCKNCNFKRK